MAGRNSVRLVDESADDILRQWFEECDSNDEDDEDFAAKADGSDEEDFTEVQSEYDSENECYVESTSSDNVSEQNNFYIRSTKAWRFMEKSGCRGVSTSVGLLILAGVCKSHNEGTTKLWNVEDGRPIFNTMSTF
ncbi:hypothetical protein CBL_08573 [Carabus blaptoides fortunei]